MPETASTMPGRMRLIWIGDEEDDSGRRQVFSDSVSHCTWTRPATWDASGRLLVRSMLGQETAGTQPLASGVISRHGDGRETLRSTCGHLLHLDGAGGARVDTPYCTRHAPRRRLLRA